MPSILSGYFILLNFLYVFSPTYGLPGAVKVDMLDYRTFLNSTTTKNLLSMPRKRKVEDTSNTDNSDTSSSSSSKSKLGVVWMAPFFSGGGYCSEATAFVMGLDGISDYPITINQHGDSLNTKYMFGLSNDQYQYLQYIASKQLPERAKVISICHSEPGAWQVSRSLPMRYSTTV